jgi:hypothetical protein
VEVERVADLIERDGVTVRMDTDELGQKMLRYFRGMTSAAHVTSAACAVLAHAAQGSGVRSGGEDMSVVWAATSLESGRFSQVRDVRT